MKERWFAGETNMPSGDLSARGLDSRQPRSQRSPDVDQRR